MFAGDALVACDQDFTVFIHDVKACHFTAQTLGIHRNESAFFGQRDFGKVEESFQNLLWRHTDGFEQNGHRHLTTTIHAEVQHVFRIKLEIQP